VRRHALAAGVVLAVAGLLIAMCASVGEWDGVAVAAIIAGILLARLARGWRASR
jgi:hypothetical protein